MVNEHIAFRADQSSIVQVGPKRRGRPPKVCKSTQKRAARTRLCLGGKMPKDDCGASKEKVHDSYSIPWGYRWWTTCHCPRSVRYLWYVYIVFDQIWVLLSIWSWEILSCINSCINLDRLWWVVWIYGYCIIDMLLHPSCVLLTWEPRNNRTCQDPGVKMLVFDSGISPYIIITSAVVAQWLTWRSNKG